MKEKTSEYKTLFSNRKFLISVALTIIFLVIALFINFYAGMYATESASSPVTDIILSNTPVYDLDGLFVYGTFLLTFFIFLISFHKPQRIPFVGKSVALFVIIRSIF